MLIILPSLAGGGAEKVTLSLCSNLEYKNVDCKLILLNALGPLKPRIKKDNLIDLKSKRFRNALPSLLKTINLINYLINQTNSSISLLSTFREK